MTMTEYRWTPFSLGPSTKEAEEMSEAAIKALLDESITKYIGDLRVSLGYSRTPSRREIAAENYCHECGREYDDD
jgi:hypothetical protein